MAPRGPDGSGAWSEGPIALGARRLSIIDLSSAGSQPMVDQRLGLTIVFNGCIYNHESLRNTLLGRGHTFSSHSDTEVIVKAYAEWGTECVRRFRGMFAFAIVEHDSGRVVLARDRLGVKPLYLDHVSGTVAIRLHLARVAGRRRCGHLDRQGRAQSLPELPLGGRPAADHPHRRAEAAAGHRPGDRT